MRVLWTKIKYIEKSARLLYRNCVDERIVDLSKEVLWVSVGQKAAELPAIKVGGLKKNSAERPVAGEVGSNQAARQNSFLTSNFDG